MVISASHRNCFQILLSFLSHNLFMRIFCLHFKDYSSALFLFCLSFHFRESLSENFCPDFNVSRVITPPPFGLLVSTDQCSHLLRSILFLYYLFSLFIFNKFWSNYLLIILYHFVHDHSFGFQVITVLIPDNLSILISSIQPPLSISGVFGLSSVFWHCGYQCYLYFFVIYVVCIL